MKSERITQKAEKVVRETLERAQRVSKEAMGKFPFAEEIDEGGKPAEQAKPSESPLVRLSIRSVYKLEELDSEIRHSVVEICFYNLKLFAQMIKEKYDKPAFLEKLKQNIAELPSVKQKLLDYFDKEIESGVAVRSIFEKEADEVSSQIESLNDHLSEWEKEIQNPISREKISTLVPERIDAIMTNLGKVKCAIDAYKDAHKVNIPELIRHVFSLQDERLKQENIEVEFGFSDCSIFAHRESLLDAFTEIIRNTRHAFNGTPDGKEKKLTVKVENSYNNKKGVLITFTDNGNGSIPTTTEGKGLSIVRKIVEDKHTGKLEIAGKHNEGTQIKIFLRQG